MRQIGEHNSALLICIAIGSVWFAKCVGQDAFAEPAKRDNGTFQRESGDGTDPNRLNKNGQTLLHIAVAEQNSEAARILLDHGAKYDIPNREGKTALDVALTGGLAHDVSILLGVGRHLGS